jgi:hypothetical protein
MKDKVYTLTELIPISVVWVFTFIDGMAELFIDRALPFPCYPAIFFIMCVIVNGVAAMRFSGKVGRCSRDPLCIKVDDRPTGVEGHMIHFFDGDEPIAKFFRYRDDQERVMHRLSEN